MFQHAQHSFVRLQSFRRRFGWRATLARVAQELRKPASPPGVSHPPAADRPANGTQWAPIPRGHGVLSAPIRFYATPRRNRRRVTLIGESFDLRHPCDAAATAMILATVTANRLGADLRVVTRMRAAQPTELDELLRLNDLTLQGEAMFQWAPAQGPDAELDRFDDELMLATSWQSALATLAMVPARQVVYLVQADERALHPWGDQRARCEAVLQRQDLRFVVHTQQLKAYLVNQGLPHFETCAVSFEPAFPARAFHALPRGQAAKRRFIFHAPPSRDRHLFRLGLAAIEQALMLGVLDPRRWELLFVGRDMPEVVLASGQRPHRLQDLDGTAYARLLGESDLGLSLSPAGLPSRTPLEMAASGAVVVVNTGAHPHGAPDRLSRNIIACDADRDALVQGLRAGISVVEDNPQRRTQYTQTALTRDWAHTLHGIVEQLAIPR